MNIVLLYTAAGILVVWGIAHIVPTSAVVRGFGDINLDNRRIITMEWVAEGLILVFDGLLVLLVTALAGPDETAAVVVYRASAGMLLIMAVWTAFTGARTSIVPIKICPFVKLFCAISILIASLSLTA